MPDESYRRTYYQADFASFAGSLAASKPLLETALGELDLSVPVNEVRLALGGAAAIVEWQSLPLPADVLLVDGAVAAFEGGSTTSEPFELESFGVTQSTGATPVLKATLATGPLDGGTYAFNWNSLLRMNPAGAASGVKGTVRITRSDGVFREQPDSWDLTAEHAFNGSLTFKVTAGQTLTATAHVVRLGSNGTAEMLGLRFTIDQLAPAAS